MLPDPSTASIFGGRLAARRILSLTTDPGGGPSPGGGPGPGGGDPPRSEPRAGAPPPGGIAPGSPGAAARAGAIDARLIEILEAPLAGGETAAIGFRRKEQEIGAVFAALSAIESRALLARLEAARAGDRLVEKFTRLTAERRHRLLAFLADARRREALRLTQPRR